LVSPAVEVVYEAAGHHTDVGPKNRLRDPMFAEPSAGVPYCSDR
jgi:hypothetical protein